MFEFNIPTGFNNKAQGCGTPLPWVGNPPQFQFTPTGLRHIGANAVCENRRNSVGVEKRKGERRSSKVAGYRNLGLCYGIPLGFLRHTSASHYPTLKGKVQVMTRAQLGNETKCFFSLLCDPLRRSAPLRSRSPFPLHPSSFILLFPCILCIPWLTKRSYPHETGGCHSQ